MIFCYQMLFFTTKYILYKDKRRNFDAMKLIFRKWTSLCFQFKQIQFKKKNRKEAIKRTYFVWERPMTRKNLLYVELPCLLFSLSCRICMWRPLGSCQATEKKAFRLSFQHQHTITKQSSVVLQRSSVRTCCSCYYHSKYCFFLLYFC